MQDSLTNHILSIKRHYYPFGSVLYGRNFSAPSYRYAFNGKEKDDEIEGAGDSYDYGARMYEARLGRFLTVDPQYGLFPDFSPYAMALDNPIYLIDKNGQTVDPSPAFTQKYGAVFEVWKTFSTVKELLGKFESSGSLSSVKLAYDIQTGNKQNYGSTALYLTIDGKDYDLGNLGRKEKKLVKQVLADKKNFENGKAQFKIQVTVPGNDADGAAYVTLTHEAILWVQDLSKMLEKFDPSKANAVDNLFKAIENSYDDKAYKKVFSSSSAYWTTMKDIYSKLSSDFEAETDPKKKEAKKETIKSFIKTISDDMSNSAVAAGQGSNSGAVNYEKEVKKKLGIKEDNKKTNSKKSGK